MQKINKIIHKIFKWSYKDFFMAIIGCLIFSAGLNLFIVPNGLYSGGLLGASQIIRTLIYQALNINTDHDISGVIYFILNVPLFIIAYKYISKTFFTRTIVCIVFQTIFLSIIPIPSKLIVDELITNILIGGIIVGAGCGLILSSSGSGGGTDIIGIAISTHKRNLSVGKIGVAINLVIYTISGLLFGLQTAIYSIIYSIISSLIVDKTHKQNILMYVIIFTKEHPTKIIEFIRDELRRDTTIWEGIGGNKSTKTYVCCSALSKYEVERLERNIPILDNDAFMIKQEGIGIDGKFKKYLAE